MIYNKNSFLSIPGSFQALTLYFISLLLLIGFWRFIFIASHLSQLQFNNITIYFQSFFVALRLDAVIVSYFCLPVFLTIFIRNIGWESTIYRKVIFIYFSTMFNFIIINDRPISTRETSRSINTKLDLRFAASKYCAGYWTSFKTG